MGRKKVREREGIVHEKRQERKKNKGDKIKFRRERERESCMKDENKWVRCTKQFRDLLNSFLDFKGTF